MGTDPHLPPPRLCPGWRGGVSSHVTVLTLDSPDEAVED